MPRNAFMDALKMQLQLKQYDTLLNPAGRTRLELAIKYYVQIPSKQTTTTSNRPVLSGIALPLFPLISSHSDPFHCKGT